MRGKYEAPRPARKSSDIKEAVETGEILESTAFMCDNDHNLLVNLGCMRGIIPRCEGAIGIKEGTTRDIALISRVGKAVSFTVTEIKSDSSGKPYALLSRKEAQQICKKNILENHIIGDIIDARITHMESFGAFCDIGCGNIALLPIDSISVSRISHPRDRFSVGEDIKVIIRQIDNGRITLSHKELLGTWLENARLFKPQSVTTGIVRSIEDYGVFIELMPNLAGLAESCDGIKNGDVVNVYIKSILPDKMKVKLVIISKAETSIPSKNIKYDGKIHKKSVFLYWYIV